MAHRKLLKNEEQRVVPALHFSKVRDEPFDYGPSWTRTRDLSLIRTAL